MSEDVETRPGSLWLKLWPVYVILAGLIAAWRFGLFKFLSLDTLRDQQETLQAFVGENYVLAIVTYIAIYAAATLFMLPGALWITIAGGFMFGLAGGIPATIIGAPLGASLLFFTAKTSIGTALRERAGPFMKKMEAGFNENPFSCMFALRLLPVVPFPVANIAPALLGAKYRESLITTAVGIIPGVIAYTWLGAGLGATFAAGEEPNLAIIAKNMVPALAALGVVSLMPVAYKKLTRRKGNAAGTAL
ncbi:MAG: VTT domain-containing protein [Henriciella sp.]|nr:VTT domain-containing protein [Henriciella sp.]